MKRKLPSLALAAALCLCAGACARNGGHPANSGTSGAESFASLPSTQEGSEIPAPPADTEGDTPSDDFIYKSPDDAPDEIVIRKYKGWSTTVIVPAEIEGKPVTAIGGSAFAFSGVTSVTIPDSVTDIGPAAFCDCASLRHVELGNSVTLIGDKAFYDCRKLTGIVLPDSVSSIGAQAFYGCSALTALTVPDGVSSAGTQLFNDCGDILVTYRGISYDYTHTFDLLNEINREENP